MVHNDFRADIPQTAMSDAHPTDMQLRAADDIALFDPNTPNWLEILVSVHHAGRYTPKRRSVLHIPIDSSNVACVQQWRERVASLRTGG